MYDWHGFVKDPWPDVLLSRCGFIGPTPMLAATHEHRVVRGMFKGEEGSWTSLAAHTAAYSRPFCAKFARLWKAVLKSGQFPLGTERSVGAVTIDLRPRSGEPGGLASELPHLEDMKIEDKIQLQNRGIPDFWLTVFKNANVTVLNRTVEMIDEPILRSLQDITVTMPEQNTGFSLHFHFAPNEFFTNSVLTKEYDLRNDFDRRDPLDYDGPEMLRARGCDIDWKPEMNPGVKITMKKQKLKGNQTGKGGTKTILKEERRNTFFSFFQPPPISMDTQRFDDDDELFPSRWG